MAKPLTLLIDIDDTLLRLRDGAQLPTPMLEHPLLAMFRDAAIEQNGLNIAEANRRIQAVFDASPWWDWDDYLVALDFDPSAIWSKLDADAAQWLEPTHPALIEHLQTLVDVGHQLCITSNNPTSGIAHKLRLAGMSDDWQHHHLTQIFPTDRVHASKPVPEYWQFVVDALKVDLDHLVVVGNCLKDDFAVPRQIGLRRFIMFNPDPSPMVPIEQVPSEVHLIEVSDWSEMIEAVTQHSHSAMHHQRPGSIK